MYSELGVGVSGIEFSSFHCLSDQTVALDRKTSTRYFQRKLSIGYNRDADLMECEGMISAEGSGGKREIFLSRKEAF